LPSKSVEELYKNCTNLDEFYSCITVLHEKVNQAMHKMNQIEPPTSMEESKELLMWIYKTEDLVSEITELHSFVLFLSRQNTEDDTKRPLLADCIKLKNKIPALLSMLDQLFLGMSESMLKEFLLSKEMRERSLFYQERLLKTSSKQVNSELQNTLRKHMNEDSRSWFDVRQKLVNRISFKLDNTKDETMTGQEALHIMYTSHPVRSVRKKIKKLFKENVNNDKVLFATVLNQITANTENMNQAFYKEETLNMSLFQNRLTKRTLNSMTSTIDKNLARLIPYYERKAKLLGVETLDEDDLLAPVYSDQPQFTYEEAKELILQAFSNYSPKLASFVRNAMEEKWIDSENRSNKSFIEFCTFLPVSKQSRINIIYKGTLRCMSTLAHELGHAYHYDKLSSKSTFVQHMPLSIAEFSSTFTDFIFLNEMMKQNNTPEIQGLLIEEKLKAITLYILRPYTQFLFQMKLFQARTQGPLSVSQLDDLIVECQRFVYQDSLGEYNSEQWISHNLFYIPDKIFYNYQYMFGYLLSAGIHALTTNQDFSFNQFANLLEESGSLPVEDLILKHVGQDIREDEFWQIAIDYLFQDIDRYLKLTDRQ